MNKSGSQRRRGRHVGIYLNSEQYTRLQMAADQRRTTPGMLAKETVIAAIGETDAEVAAFGDALQAHKLAAMLDSPPPPPQSLTEPPPPGFRCTFKDGNYRCALETGHGGIHISAQGYRLAAAKRA